MQILMVDFGKNFLFLTLFLNGILSLIRCRFLERFTGKTVNAGMYAAYLGLSYICMFGVTGMKLQGFPAGLLFFAVTFCFVRFAMRGTGAVSLMAVLLIYVVEQAGAGMMETFNHLVIRNGTTVAEPRMRLFMVGSYLLLAALIALLYRGITWKTKLRGAEFDRYFWIVLMPVLMLFFFYSLWGEADFFNVTSVTDRGGVSFYYRTTILKEVLVFLISAAEYISVLLILFAYERVTSQIQREQESYLLRQQLALQKQYIREAEEKIRQTRALRHDFQNHLSVVGGLLAGGRAGEAEKYLEKLKIAACRLDFPYGTGNHTLDALLEDKLGEAGRLNIKVECNVEAPQKGTADDFDLCIVFANALDNALAACRETEEEKRFLKIRTERSGELYRIEVINSCQEAGAEPLKPGVGILNMQAVAKKYNGALSAETQEGRFCLNVLLILSEQPKSIPGQTG